MPKEMFYFIYRITPGAEERLGGYYSHNEADDLVRRYLEEARSKGIEDVTYEVRYEAR